MKTIELLDKPTPKKNDDSRLAFCRKDDSRLASGKNNDDNEINKFDIGINSVEHAKKSRKLSKSGKSKSEKMSKFWNLAKSRKKLSKSRNSTNFDTIKTGPKFLIPDVKTTFYCLRLALTEAPILQHFDWECHIWIETDVLGYAIGEMLSQLTSKINPDRVVTKTDLG